jgi:regulator of replication initiation timing
MSTDITTAVRGVSVGIDALKKLTELALKTKNIELQEGILSLREQLLEAKDVLLDAKEQISNYKHENAELKKEITKLKEQIANGAKDEEPKLTLGRGGYLKENNDGPFCTGCYDNNKKLIRLKEPGAGMPIYMCPVCKTSSAFSSK